jgi:hypothetical protein
MNATIEVLGGPWSMRMLRDVIFGNRHTKRATPGLGGGIAPPRQPRRTNQRIGVFG